MISLSAFLFLAQAIVLPALPATAPAADSSRPPSAIRSAIQSSRHGTHPAATPSPSPEVRVTIVNATSIPAIALGTAGSSAPLAFPYFPQGVWTGNLPLKTPAIHYFVRGLSGHTSVDRTLHFPPVSSQMLLLTGDLSTSGPPDLPPQLGLPPSPGATPWPPNLQFHIYPFGTLPNERCRYRIVNGMPSKLLVLRTLAEPNKPSHQIALLAPGNSILLLHQPSNVTWEAEINGEILTVAINQEDEQKNCLIPFFLRNEKPDFIRVFEDSNIPIDLAKDSSASE